jgi:methionyl aminopeptidase
MLMIGVCEKAETLIREKGGKPAFPCNVSVNEIAAHYTSPPRDMKTVPEKSVVKVDIGAHVDGYVADTAVTVCFDPEFDGMVETAERALKTAVENIQPEMSTSKLGSMIEKTIKSRGFKPISNLTGHQVGKYVIHAGTSIPNVSQLFSAKIRMGQVYAIEPFVTLLDAAGKVVDCDDITIFRFVKSRSLKSPYARELLKHVEDNFHTLPFAERWLQGIVPKEHYSDAFKELLSSKALTYYPVFVEASRKTVAQAEHTVLITEDGCEVLT